MNASSIFSYCFSRALLYSKSLTLFVLINFVNWKLICIFFPYFYFTLFWNWKYIAHCKLHDRRCCSDLHDCLSFQCLRNNLGLNAWAADTCELSNQEKSSHGCKEELSLSPFPEAQCCVP